MSFWHSYSYMNIIHDLRMTNGMWHARPQDGPPVGQYLVDVTVASKAVMVRWRHSSGLQSIIIIIIFWQRVCMVLKNTMCVYRASSCYDILYIYRRIYTHTDKYMQHIWIICIIYMYELYVLSLCTICLLSIVCVNVCYMYFIYLYLLYVSYVSWVSYVYIYVSYLFVICMIICNM